MLSRKFEWIEEDPDYGNSGWRPSWIVGANTTEGLGAAHDTLEHFPNCVGGFEGEMMAFGAIHVVRAQLPRDKHYTLLEGQAADLIGFLHNVHSGEQTLNEPADVPWRAVETVKEFSVAEARRMVRQTLYDFCNANAWKSESRADVLRRLPENAVERILGWMVKGVVKADRRFKRMNVTRMQLAYTFQEVERVFNQVIKQADEGEDITLRIDLQACRVTSHLSRSAWA